MRYYWQGVLLQDHARAEWWASYPAYPTLCSLPLPLSDNCETHRYHTCDVKAGAGVTCRTDGVAARIHGGSERLSTEQPGKESMPGNSAF
jgi:hypothetical protein